MTGSSSQQKRSTTSPGHIDIPPTADNLSNRPPHRSPVVPTSRPSPTARPTRPPPRQTLPIQHDSEVSETSESEVSMSEEEDQRPSSSTSKDGDKHVPAHQLSIEELKALVEQKQREAARGIHAQAPTRVISTNSGSSMLARRFSPIHEEDSTTPTISPSLEAAFASPLATGQQTTSTESTESARTIRGSVPATPLYHQPARTPSYPFPYVNPQSPRVWKSNQSQFRPFTTLSPTVSSMNVFDHTPGENTGSEVSTPAANAYNFLPSGASPIPEGDVDQYPMPNLFDVTIELNLEPGLHAWWNSVTRIINQHFLGVRASLAVPADAGDLENVPWAQIATYNEFGKPQDNPYEAIQSQFDGPKQDLARSSTPGAQRTHQRHSEDSGKPKGLSTAALLAARPSLASRHSYAGFEKNPADFSTPTPTSNVPERPKGPLRTKSHAVHLPSQGDSPRRPTFSLSNYGTPGQSTISDLDFSSIDTEMRPGPYIAVLPVLQGLNHEDHALINSTYVNRIISRGKVVALTREYRSDVPATPNVIAPSPMPKSTEVPLAKKVAEKAASITSDTSRAKMKLSADYFSREALSRPFEEFEQFPSSPWAQSPAPSPAIQNDPEENPFFASAMPQEKFAKSNVDESSFDPRDQTPDYTKTRQVEAIGVDRASTVIHIPLIHPTLSQILPSSRRKAANSQEGSDDSSSALRRAPIAILSMLSPVVPYPQHLLHSLKMLSLHLATSFGMAQQYSDAQRQASSVFHRRMQSGHKVGFAPFAADREGFAALMDADIEPPSSSVTGSITSPSDYSGRSRASPGGSLMGTPGWELNSTIAGRLSATNTPGIGYEMSDSYFDAHPTTRSPIVRNSSSGGLSVLGEEGTRPPSRKGSGHDGDRHSERHHRKSSEHQRRRTLSTDDKPSSSNAALRGSLPKKGQLTRAASQQVVDRTERKQHSYLHSYGADVGASFQMMPVLTPSGRTPGIPDDEDDFLPPPSERLLRTIIESLPVQLFTANPGTGSLTWVNSKFIAYRGKRAEAIINDPWSAIHPHDLPQYMQKWHQSLSTGQHFASKVRLQRFDSVFRWFFVRATPLKDKRQNIVHWTGTYMDIHDQHVAEQSAARQTETAASEAKYRALANSSPQIVFAATRNRGVTFCNSQWLTYSGQTEAQARALGFLDLVHPDDLDKCRLPVFNDDGTVAEVPMSMPVEIHRSDTGLSSSEDSSSSDNRTVTSPGSTPTAQLPQAKLSKLATQGILKVSKDSDGRPSYSTEVRLRNKDGEYRWHLVRVLQAEPVRKDEDEEEETWYGTCTDINDHKLLEQTLKETMDAKTRFLSNMSHEIRTPLNGIMGMVNFLIDSMLTQEQLEHVNIIRSSTEGLRDLINDILDLSKVEAGMITLQMEWFHVRTLVEEVNDLTSSMAIGKGLELNYLIEDAVPSSVKGDRFRIRQVLLNVVGNAIKFTQSGEVFVKVEKYVDDISDLGEEEVMVRFSIVDTGSGFTKEEAEFLFKRFSQIDSSSTKQHGGTGLGLAISKQLVQLHGGDMDASSVPGEGASFFFHAKFQLPSDDDHPPTAIGTPGLVSAAVTPGFAPPRRPSAVLAHWSPQLARQDSDSSALSASSPLRHESNASSGSSDPSINTNRTSLMSQRSSISSLASVQTPPMVLAMPPRHKSSEGSTPGSEDSTPSSVATVRARSGSSAISPGHKSPPPPALFSILVICPFVYARQAIVRHIETTIPQTSPHHITAPDSLEECKKLLGADGDPVIFTHVVLISHDAHDIAEFARKIIESTSYSSTSLVVISDFTQRKEIEEVLGEADFKKLIETGRLRWLSKPLKPSKFAIVFDPQKLRELSTDRTQDSAQQVVLSQKQIFEEMKKRLGNKGMRVLLVEDNKTNQMVLQKFLKKVEIGVDTVVDGQQCTDAVLGHDHGYYSIILCDLHMPVKDGYATCREIRKHEKKNKFKPMPIIALSANVLGDVYQQCADAGFNSYVTKPVDFKELSGVMLRYLDPADPNKPIEFMKRKK